MVSTHRTDVDGLDAPHSTVVLQLYAREVAQGVGHAVGIEPLQQLAVQLLAGHHLAQGGLRHHNHLPHVLHGVQPTLCHQCVTSATGKCQKGAPLTSHLLLLTSISLHRPNPRGQRKHHQTGRSSDSSPGCERLPGHRPVTHLFAPSIRAIHSSGTVRDFHPIPFSAHHMHLLRVQRYE